MKKQLKAFILAAGLGTRLRPMTDTCPKPLISIFGVPLLYLVLEKLSQLGVDEIFINGHHLHTEIEKALLKYPLSVKTTFLYEKEILGTAGALGAIKNQIRGSDLLIINGDILTDYDLSKLVKVHQETSAYASMGLLLQNPRGKTPIYCSESQILGIGDIPKETYKIYGYTCAHILSPNFIDRIPDSGPSEIIPFYKDCIKSEQKISYSVSDAIWFDIGSPQMYFQAHIRLLQELNTLKESFYLSTAWKKLGISPQFKDKLYFSKNPFTLSNSSKFGPFVFNLSEMKDFPNNTNLVNTILLPEFEYKEILSFENSIVGKDFKIDVMSSHV